MSTTTIDVTASIDFTHREDEEGALLTILNVHTAARQQQTQITHTQGRDRRQRCQHGQRGTHTQDNSAAEIAPKDSPAGGGQEEGAAAAASASFPGATTLKWSKLIIGRRGPMISLCNTLKTWKSLLSCSGSGVVVVVHGCSALAVTDKTNLLLRTTSLGQS